MADGFDYHMVFVDTGNVMLAGSIELEMRENEAYFYDFGNIETLPGYPTLTLSDQAFQWKRLFKTIRNKWDKVNALNETPPVNGSGGVFCLNMAYDRGFEIASSIMFNVP